MAKIKTILVDDEQNNLDLLAHFIEKYCKNIDIVARCVTYGKALETLKTMEFELVFLDIVLDRDTSFDLLEELDEINFHIVFCTAYDEYAVRAFKYNTIDYLLKPVVIDELVKAVDRSIDRIQSGSFSQRDVFSQLSTMVNQQRLQSSMVISKMDSVTIINPLEILYFQASGRYTEIHVLNQKKPLISSKPIGDHEAKLDESLFYRIHNSYIINLHNLSSIDRKSGNYCVLNNGMKLPISRRRVEGILRIFRPT